MPPNDKFSTIKHGVATLNDLVQKQQDDLDKTIADIAELNLQVKELTLAISQIVEQLLK